MQFNFCEFFNLIKGVFKPVSRKTFQVSRFFNQVRTWWSTGQCDPTEMRKDNWRGSRKSQREDGTHAKVPRTIPSVYSFIDQVTFTYVSTFIVLVWWLCLRVPWSFIYQRPYHSTIVDFPLFPSIPTLSLICNSSLLWVVMTLCQWIRIDWTNYSRNVVVLDIKSKILRFKEERDKGE